jgi:hypothetical protein
MAVAQHLDGPRHATGGLMAHPDSQIGKVLRYINCKGKTNEETLANMAALFSRRTDEATRATRGLERSSPPARS